MLSPLKSTPSSIPPFPSVHDQIDILRHNYRNLCPKIHCIFFFWVQNWQVVVLTRVFHVRIYTFAHNCNIQVLKMFYKARFCVWRDWFYTEWDLHLFRLNYRTRWKLFRCRDWVFWLFFFPFFKIISQKITYAYIMLAVGLFLRYVQYYFFFWLLIM